jgi:hypothetical protein
VKTSSPLPGDSVNFNSANAFREQGKKQREQGCRAASTSTSSSWRIQQNKCAPCIFFRFANSLLLLLVASIAILLCGAKASEWPYFKDWKKLRGFQLSQLPPPESAQLRFCFQLETHLLMPSQLLFAAAHMLLLSPLFQTGGRCLVSAPRSSQQSTLLLINQSRASVKTRKAVFFCICLKTVVDFKMRKK